MIKTTKHSKIKLNKQILIRGGLSLLAVITISVIIFVATRRGRPKTTPDQPPVQTPGQTPGQTPDKTPDQTPEQPPVQTPDQIPYQTPDQTPDQIPYQTIPQTTQSPTTLSSSIIEQIFGCTNEYSFNYNPEANTERVPSSCINKKLGCTDPNAINYNPEANTEQVPSYCIEKIFGCTDINASNYDSNANTDNVPSSCVAKIFGCTDINASNYDSNANTDNVPSSCIARIFGCTDINASNYDSNANTDNGTCVMFLEGCTDYSANNYNSNANKDNGTCNYQPWKKCNGMNSTSTSTGAQNDADTCKLMCKQSQRYNNKPCKFWQYDSNAISYSRCKHSNESIGRNACGTVEVSGVTGGGVPQSGWIPDAPPSNTKPELPCDVDDYGNQSGFAWAMPYSNAYTCATMARYGHCNKSGIYKGWPRTVKDVCAKSCNKSCQP